MVLDWLRWRAWASFGVVAAAVCLGGVALSDIYLYFAWQAWHVVTSTVSLRGRCGAYGTGLALVARLGSVWPRGRRGCLRGRRGTYGTGLAPVVRLGLVWRRGRRGCLRGRRGAWRTLTFTLRGRRGTW